MTKPLRIALTKGRLEKDTVGLLEKLGYDCEAVHNKGRRLILPIPDGNMEVVLSKAADVITYVEHGVCDLGVVGKDTILEMSGKFFELADLGFENGLEVVEEIVPISARLIANVVSLKMRQQEIESLIQKIEEVL